MARITSTQFIKTPGAFQDEAQRAPVWITKHNRDHTVLVSAVEYERLKRRDREVLRIENFSEEDIAAIAASRAPEEAAAFNHEYESDGE